MLGALQWRSYIGDQQTREVQTTTATAKASLTGAVQRDEDLAETLRGVVSSGAPVTNSQLQELYDNVPAFNDAGVVGLGYIERVPAGQLASFTRQTAADPPLGQPVAMSPPSPGKMRPFYCLIRDIVSSPNGASDLSAAGVAALTPQLSAEYDNCTGTNAAAFTSSASTGSETVTLLGARLDRALDSSVANRLFEVLVPIYRADLPTKTTAERETALLGWVEGLFSPVPILNPVVDKTTGVSVALYYRNNSGPLLVANTGPGPSGGRLNTVSLSADSAWSALITVLPANASATVQGIGVLVDLLVILLLVGLIMSLFRSRRRAFVSIARTNAELQHRALHDSLTGLPNRDLMLEIGTTMLERAELDGQPVAALLVDLDGFNGVNDTYGHRVGDQMLVAIAGRLAAALGPADTLGRLAGDEFVILAEGPSIAEGADVLAERLLVELAAPFEVSGGSAGEALVRLTACIGVALGPGRSAEDLLRDADTALNEAKETGRRRFTVFEPAMHTAAQNRLALTGELRTALELQQFYLDYQPVFSLEDSCPTGVEALLRWRHPVRGVIPPLDFIPLLEETGMIADVGREVLRMACEQAVHWERRGMPISVSVNASAIQLESDQFCQDVSDMLAQSQLDPSRLTIEITESALMRDVHDTVRRLADLKALGVQLAIDDFGTGYSSLAYLRQFPVDVLKIDRSFVSAMTRSTGGMALVRTMIELGQALNLVTVAEGIEEPEELHALVLEHCRAGQGFLLAKPLDPTQIELFFDNARPRDLHTVLA